MNRAVTALRVRLITGSAPPDLCGVGAYTAGLAEALRELGVDAELVLQRRTDRLGAVIARQPSDAIVHLQYPTVGIGAGFGPLFGLLRRRRVVLTQHEFSYAHPLRRAMAVALANVAGQVIVSNTVEQQRLGRWLPGKVLTVLPVPTNIPVSMVADPRPYRAVGGAAPGRPFTVGWFGIVRPDQGLEQFLELVALARHHGAAARFVVIGAWHTHDAEAIAALQQRTRGWPLRWTGPLAPEGVSAELAQLDAAYLPFPDGLSERRASAVALFGHRVPVISPVGAATTAELRDATLPAASVTEAWRQLTELDGRRLAELVARAERYAEVRTMARLAEQHLALYQAAASPAALTTEWPRGVGTRADSMT